MKKRWVKRGREKIALKAKTEMRAPQKKKKQSGKRAQTKTDKNFKQISLLGRKMSTKVKKEGGNRALKKAPQKNYTKKRGRSK